MRLVVISGSSAFIINTTLVDLDRAFTEFNERFYRHYGYSLERDHCTVMFASKFDS